MSESKSTKLYNFLNNHKYLYLIAGIILFATGIFFSEYYVETVIIIVVSHFLLIFGEALIVFFLINVVLETETRKSFLAETSRQIKEQEEKLIESFDKTAKTLLTKTENLFHDINEGFFKVMLAERTSPEIAEQMNKSNFFNLGFLYFDYKMRYEFTIDKPSNNVLLLQKDEFTVKNLSRTNLEYNLPISIDEALNKTYNFISAGYCDNLKHPEFTELIADDFDITPIVNVKSGLNYCLKDTFGKTLQPNECLRIYTQIRTTFTNPSSVDDFAFMSHYMMPWDLEVIVPSGYTFHIHPTFPPETMKPPRRVRKGEFVYQIPFLTPGQGYNFSLVKP